MWLVVGIQCGPVGEIVSVFIAERFVKKCTVNVCKYTVQ